MNLNVTAGILALLMAASGLQSASGAANPNVMPINQEDKPMHEINEYLEAEPIDARALNEFSSKLWAALANGKDTALSPLSAYLALAMCAAGARGDTLEAFNLLGFDDPEGAYDMIEALTSQLSSTGGETELLIANSIWVDNAFNVREDYLQLLDEKFAAEAFSEHLSGAAGKVNNWISDKTRGMIQNMLDEIDPSVVTLLVNTIYMDAKWQTPFDKSVTDTRTFHSVDGDADAEFMHRRSDELVIDDDELGVTGVVLPYDDGRLIFTAIMPDDESVTTSDLISKLQGDKSIDRLAAGACSEKVILSLPKFEIKSSMSLKSALSAIGMADAFGESADFSGIGASASGQSPTIGEVLQNARIRVDESGTEAAAATVVMMRLTAFVPEEPPRVLCFDRPFVWAVVDSASGAILFCGQNT